MDKLRQIIRKLIKESLSENEVDESKLIIKNATKEDFDQLIGVCDNSLHFKGFKNICSTDPYQRIKNLFDPDLTFKAIYDGKVVGFYFLSDKESLFDWAKKYFKIDLNNIKKSEKTYKKYILNWEFNHKLLEKIKDKRGVQGVALGVNSEYRGLGIGKKLLELPANLGYDYIWGIQSVGLSDVNAWLKRREVLMKINTFLVTVQLF